MKYYTVKETAKILGKSVRRIQAEIKQGHFPQALAPRGWFIPESDIDANKRGKIIDRRRKK